MTTLRARHRDQAGNLGAWSDPVAVRRDQTPPPLLPNDSSEAWRNSSTLPVSWTLPAADDGSPYASVDIETCTPDDGCRTDTHPAGNETADLVISGTGEGTIRARLIDEAGNVGEWSAARPVRVDINPPPASTLGTAQPGQGGTYVIPVAVANDNQSQIVRLTGQICTAADSCQPLPPQPGGTTTQVFTDPLAPGTYTVGVAAIDQAGNTGDQATTTFTVGAAVTPTPTPTANTSPTPTPSASPTVTPTATPTATPSPTPSVTPTSSMPRRRAKLRVRHLRLGRAALHLQVVVSGATGTVEVVYRARVSSARQTARRGARLSRGRVVVRLRIPVIARAPRAIITVRYLGDATHRRAVARRHVRRSR